MEPKLQGEKLVKCPRRSEGISQSYKPIKSENPKMKDKITYKPLEPCPFPCRQPDKTWTWKR